MLGLEGKKILVTASTRGIGFGIAKVLLREGAIVTINGRYKKTVEEALSNLRSEFPKARVYGVNADLTVKEDVERLVNEAYKLMGGLDGVAYVTGPPKGGYFSELNDDDWNYGFKLLVMSAVWISRYSIPYLLKSKGSIVFVTSIAIREPIPSIALSNTLRIAIAGLIKSLVREYSPKGIRFNMVLPGYVLTDRLMSLAKRWSEEKGVSVDEYLKNLADKVPLKRVAKPEEIGEVVAFLLSPRASYVNGAAVPVDGGLILHVF